MVARARRGRGRRAVRCILGRMVVGIRQDFNVTRVFWKGEDLWNVIFDREREMGFLRTVRPSLLC